MKRFIRRALCAALLAAPLAYAAVASAAIVPVEFKMNPSLKGREQVRAMNAITALGAVKSFKGGTFVIDATSEQEALRIADSLREQKHVLWAQAAISVGVDDTPSDFSASVMSIEVTDVRQAASLVGSLSASTGKPLKLLRVASGNRVLVGFSEEPQSAEFAAVAVAAQSMARVVAVNRVRLLDHQWMANDSLHATQWSLGDGVGGIRASAAWDLTPSAVVPIGIIDTGIRRHEDLDGKFVSGYDMIRNGFVASDGNSRDADPADPGDADVNRVCPSRSGRPSTWHGTHVAGIAAAMTNNGAGVSGVSPNSTIQSIRALGVCGGFDEDIADAIRWAAGAPVPDAPLNPNPVKVVNLSLGGPGPCGSVLQSAVDAAIARGTTVVVAAGNSATVVENFSPANCKGVIAVGASNLLGNLSSYSNFGPEISLLAPGGDRGTLPGILSTLNGGGTAPAVQSYASYIGTSMAAPHVAGVVALMLARDPSLTPGQVLNRLKASARPFPAGTNCAGTTNVCGAGLLDAANAVASVAINRGVNEVAASRDRVHIVELQNNFNGRYLLSADPTEINRLVGNGWTRTGQIFPSYSFTTNIGEGASIPQPVCRAKLFGHDAYRYTANTGECKEQINANGMATDGVVFMAALPNANVCPSGSSPAWEMSRFNQAENLYNFRTLTDANEMAGMSVNGWQMSRVAFCVPN